MRNTSKALLAAGALSASAAWADDAVRYSKAEVDALVAKKKIEWTRARDDAKITWAFKDDGNVFFTTSRTTRNIPINGTYTVTDRGSICFKWTQDKYVAMQDGCVAFAHDGAKTMVTNASDSTRVLGQVDE